MTLKVLGFQLHPKSSSTLELCWCQMEIGPQHYKPEQGLLSVTVLYESLTANSNSACVLLYCLNHVVNTVPLLLRKPLFSCSSVKHIMFYCGFEGFIFPSNCIQHALDSLGISGTVLA